jgi:hypothetical protein
MLATATKVVDDLAKEISALKVLLDSESSRSDLYTALSKHAHAVSLGQSAAPANDVQPVKDDREKQDLHDAHGQPPIAPTKTGRNPKGASERAIVEALASGEERDIDYIMGYVNERLPSPLKRGMVRTALMFAKDNGAIISRKPGYFQIAQKGESLADSTATNSEGEAFNLQPSPDQGR